MAFGKDRVVVNNNIDWLCLFVCFLLYLLSPLFSMMTCYILMVVQPKIKDKQLSALVAELLDSDPVSERKRDVKRTMCFVPLYNLQTCEIISK